MSNWVDKRLNEFKRSLDKYLHLLKGGRIDVDKAALVERVELELVEELRNTGKCNGGLQDILGSLESTGWLEKAFHKAAESLNAEVPGGINVRDALQSFLTGNMEDAGANIIAVVVQAVARCVAEKRLEEEGVRDAQTPFCPVCGAESKTIVVRDTGYHMVCPFCGYEWRVSRDKVICPYCGNSNPISIGVFTDKARRIGLMVCQECGATWRTIMDRNIKAPRILLPIISLGAEAFRKFLHEDMLGGGEKTS